MVLVPVVGELLDDDPVLRHALDELVGAGADRMEGKLVAAGLGRLGRNHHAGAIGELGQQGSKGRLEVELDGEWVDHLDRLDDADLRSAERALHEEMAVEAVLGGLGVERLAVVELHARPQFQRDGLAVRRRLVAERQLRHDVGLLVDIEQLVAEGGKDDARRIEARGRGIERIAVVTQPDAQVGLGESRQG